MCSIISKKDHNTIPWMNISPIYFNSQKLHQPTPKVILYKSVLVSDQILSTQHSCIVDTNCDKLWVKIILTSTKLFSQSIIKSYR